MKNFMENIMDLSRLNNVEFTKEQIQKLYKYKELLLEWNTRMNLTSITEENDIIVKHFIDSAIVNKYIKSEDNLIDVGTGAGFPRSSVKNIKQFLRNNIIRFIE